MGKKLTKFVGVRVTEEMYEALTEEADKMGLRIADLGRWALAEMVMRGKVIFPTNKMNQWCQAYELWQQYWGGWDGELYYLDKYQDARCFLCGGLWEEGHYKWCVYTSVCKLLGVEPR